MGKLATPATVISSSKTMSSRLVGSDFKRDEGKKKD